MKPITINTDKFSRAMRGLRDVSGKSTRVFVRNEARLMAEELAKQFTPKLDKSKKGIAIDRRLAFRVGPVGATSLPWKRLQAIINRQRPGGQKPLVQAAVAMPLQRKAILRIGTLAAGFIGRGNVLAANAKSFVMGHVPKCYGDVTQLFSLTGTRIRLRNWTPWLQDMRGAAFLVQRAVNKRAGAMRANSKRIAAGLRTYMAGRL